MTRKQFLAVVSLWLVLIFGLIGAKQFTILTGTTVLLQTAPVDPRDIFRGDYVTLRYTISDYNSIPFESGSFHPSTQPVQSFTGDTIYVVLRQENGVGVPVYKTPTRPRSGLFIKGTIVGYDPSRYQIEYGIESYFVPEGTGRDLERARGGNTFVRVSIDAGGTAIIRDIVVREGGVTVPFQTPTPTLIRTPQPF